MDAVVVEGCEEEVLPLAGGIGKGSRPRVGVHHQYRERENKRTSLRFQESGHGGDLRSSSASNVRFWMAKPTLLNMMCRRLGKSGGWAVTSIKCELSTDVRRKQTALI